LHTLQLLHDSQSIGASPADTLAAEYVARCSSVSMASQLVLRTPGRGESWGTTNRRVGAPGVGRFYPPGVGRFYPPGVGRFYPPGAGR
jgi:hypothetical protein